MLEAQGADAELATVYTELAWHSMFIRALLIRPERSELAHYVPDFTIVCLPSFKADPKRHGVRSETVIAINFTQTHHPDRRHPTTPAR